MSADDFLGRGLWLDLEIGGDKLHAVGGFFQGETVAETKASGLTAALQRLDDLAQRADYVAGHNLLEHDLPFLQAHHPGLRLLRLPVVDTLLLSPLAFPENPYHRLVKDYKLVSTAVNDPTADARQAAVLLGDEFRQFQDRQRNDPALAGLGFAAMTGESVPALSREGVSLFFTAVGVPQPNFEQFASLLTERFQGRVCRTALNYVLLKNSAAVLATPSMGYVAAWLAVAGQNSVLPPWVRQRYPETVEIVQSLRCVPCDDTACDYCKQAHDSKAQLKRFFGFEDFRKQPDGRNLQEEIVRAGMADNPLLAILPTGGGKSLCYQLPAMAHHFQRGLLTIVISPLQALMKDQVDNLIARTGMPLAGALHGMLTPPERGDTLERIRLGDLALLYVAPEQLRNRSFREAIAQREIGAWVFDEAHCLSKWGHDFRPDYLYASRFIRELAARQSQSPPPVMCFTATAKKEVTEEIVEHFKEMLGQELKVFYGGSERHNLRFEVQSVTAPTKWERVHELLGESVGSDPAAAAVVYSATRKGAELLATYLASKSWRAAAFHAGLNAAEKRRIQEEFIGNQLQVICATNAFGMGIDKENIRLVLHADIPGSLENYLQEAGRAGRDSREARCVLLYDEQDIEKQFGLSALSQLGRKDVAEILRVLRRSRRGRSDEVVITSGELLRDDQIEISFGAEDSLADTKVKTAIALLERGGFIQRNENKTQVFQGRPLVRSVEEARETMARLNISAKTQAQWEAILIRLFNSRPDEGFSADELAELPVLREAFEAHRREYQSKAGEKNAQPPRDTSWVMRILNDMAEAGLIKRDMLLTAFVRHGGTRSPARRFDKLVKLEQAMLDTLRTEAPDADGWMPLHLPSLNQRLRNDGHDCAPEVLVGLLRSLAAASHGIAGAREGLEYRSISRDRARVKLRRDWDSVLELAEKRRAVAALTLSVLTGKIPAGTPDGEDCLVAFSADDINQALDADLVLAAQVRDRQHALERALLLLHEQKIIILQQGLAVFRQAMTIRIDPDSRTRRFTKSDFEPMAQHYSQRVFQVHAMNEYAHLGLDRIREALELVIAYFEMDRKEFIRRFFAARKDILERATTEESYRRIVESLNNQNQQDIVTAGAEDNLLILAGPGSGKTKVVVHRCAYLLLVERVPASAILVVCFNRHAALEARRRLIELAGDDGRRVAVQTYHGLAMRLAGASFVDRPTGTAIDFDAVLDRAIQLLKGEADLPGVAEDELRDRLLAGYRYILVDEYQDIQSRQYDLVSALAGRTLADPDAKLTILAVGDDDQNVYAFLGANVEYIHRFQKDYDARICHLLENYRSTKNIINAANRLIAHNRDRMKINHPIRPDHARAADPPGGALQTADPLGRGRVQVLDVPDVASQASAVLDEVKRLRGLKPFDWAAAAVLASTNEELVPIRTLCERQKIPVRWSLSCDGGLPLVRVREVDQFLQALRQRHGTLVRAGDLRPLLPPDQQCNHWHRVVLELLQSWGETTEGAEQPTEALTDFIYTTLMEERRQQRFGQGLLLSTVHGAKGMEYDQVVILGGGWSPSAAKEEEETRRLFYVGMSRARQTLTLIRRADSQHRVINDLRGEEASLLQRPVQPTESLPNELLQRRYAVLGLSEIFLDYAGQREKSDAIHAALNTLRFGDALKMQANGDAVELVTPQNVRVAVLAKGVKGQWRERLQQVESVRVLAICVRRADDVTDSDYRKRLRVNAWEIPVVEVTWRASAEVGFS